MSVKSMKEEDHTHELFTEVHLPKTLSTEEAIGETLPEVQQWQPSPQYSPIVNTLEYCGVL